MPVRVDLLPDGRRRVTVDSDVFGTVSSWETGYSPELIDRIVAVKGETYVCDELRREEDEKYVSLALRTGLLAFSDEREFHRKRMLDFGCGGGASSVILARLFPDAYVVGVDLDRTLLDVARLRAKHYGLRNVSFIPSPGPDELPAELEPFDFVVLSAVFEHLLPDEREMLLPKIWTALVPGGRLFVNQTPHRWYPIEYHTTGIPCLNYVPAPLALRLARLSPRVPRDATWPELLRQGIRGGTEGQIRRLLPGAASLRPRDRHWADVWYEMSMTRAPHPLKRTMRTAFRVISAMTRTSFTPTLLLAFEKRR